MGDFRPEQLKEVLVVMAHRMKAHALSAPVEGGQESDTRGRRRTRVGRRESVEAFGRLESYLAALPADDPRLVEIAGKVADPVELTLAVPDDEDVPADGPAFLAWLTRASERVVWRRG